MHLAAVKPVNNIAVTILVSREHFLYKSVHVVDVLLVASVYFGGIRSATVQR